ncbi:hypothetical protein BGZ52_004733 [Haplosporangium bisporale]|nr:hypothetical protein BGZ52_004733 [Haplosporangium bisporale]KAF9211072.1 hypothetical protein BGZ59_008562 [Podila verticillata]KFH66595.1 hypothetical protein MVEG_07120 [Podila verticillata NRRL 6337]
MAYYNNSGSSPRQGFASPPMTNRSTKPVNYISSPFDEDSAASYNNNNHSQYEKNDPSVNPYNPDYMTSSQRSNSFNQSQHSTQEYPLSPGQSEKHLATGAGAGAGEAYAMQHLSAAHDGSRGYDNYQGSPYSNNNMNGRDSYSNNQNYYNGYDEDRPSLSNDTAPMRPLTDVETSDGIARGKSGVSRVKYDTRDKPRCCPCIRSRCGRVTCCICLFLLLVIIALAIVVVTVFKLPTVNYLGTQGDPAFQINQGNVTFGVTLTANIQVINPNPLGFHFESIIATAYYPNYAPSIGGGQVTNVDFPKKSNVTIPFPIAASYNRADDKGLVVVGDILKRCGYGGGTNVGLTINYDLKLTIKIIGISISPTIKNQHSNFACPPNFTELAGGLDLPA